MADKIEIDILNQLACECRTDNEKDSKKDSSSSYRNKSALSDTSMSKTRSKKYL